ncbi:MAG TPA: ADP-glyceromanno-heptose 6-epimerase [Alphaproteobacteria bacterium]|nr:ADP-glyceromanno-heptose 6-epimerase [Alphaproteobacteria bacterium]
MIIITGGAGFIGSNLAAALEKAGAGPLVICDVLGNDQKWKNIAKRTLDDVLLPAQLFTFLEANKKRVETVFHMGAISATTETDADKIIANNFRLSKDVFTWCAENKKRFIYASSAATYGDGKLGFEDKEDLASLKMLRPLNPYGWSKHLFDQFVAQAKASGAKLPPQCVGLKFFNVYGPNEYHKDDQSSVAVQIFPYAAQGKPFPLFKSHHASYPDGGQKRDFIWVGDCTDVMLWLHSKPGVNGLFNLGTGQARSFHDLARAVYRACGHEPNIVYRDTPENIRAQYQYFTEAPMQKLLTAGYNKPFTSLEDGVTRYVQGFLTAPDPFC